MNRTECQQKFSLISPLGFLMVLVSCIEIVSSAGIPDVFLNTQTFFQVASQELITPNAYEQQAYTNTFTVTYSNAFNDPQSSIVFGISGLELKQSAASLSFLITATKNGNGGGGTSSYDYTFDILNETVLYRVKLQSAIIDLSKVEEVLHESNQLTCQILNKGVGYRSENITFPTSLKSQFKQQARQIYAVVYYKGFNLFNPNGTFFYLAWEFNYNVTQYTILFKTMDSNIISSIDYSVLIVDLNYAADDMNYNRFFIVEVVGCSNSSSDGCPGKNGWPLYNGPNSPGNHNLSTSYLFGLTAFHIAKHVEAKWIFDQSNLLNLNNAYEQSPSFVWANMSVFIVSMRDCADNSRYLDPNVLNACENSCAGIGTYPFNSNSNPKVCKKCHYSCQPGFCSDETNNKCNQCDPNKSRYNDTNPPNFRCLCATGYLDMGIEQCQPCSKYIPGCFRCNSPTNCQQCDSDKTLTGAAGSKKCKCTSPNKYMTLDGSCRSIFGCINYFNDPVKGWMCTSCNFTENLFMDNYTCSCIVGYTMQLMPDLVTKFCQADPVVCGDGIRVASEPCDDNNHINNDGCDSSCQIETDYLCFADLRETSFCLQSRTTLKFVGTMKIQGQTKADLYFSLKPYNDYLDNVGFLAKFITTSISNYSSMQHLTFFTELNLDDDQLRIRLRLDYTQAINSSIQHNMTFYVFDSTHEFEVETKFNIEAVNIQLLMQEGYSNFNALNYIVLVLIILAFIALMISLFKQNWIGIELIHTFQFCFFYFILLADIDQKQVKYLSFLELSNGYNQMEDHLSIYEYLDFNRKIYLMNFRKEILINFNLTSILFTIPIIMLIIKAVRPVFQKCVKNNNEKKAKTVNDNQPIKHKKQTQLDYFLSSQFIVGKLFVTLSLAFMNQILFCFFIQQTPYLQQNQVFNGLFEQIFLFLMVSSCLLTIGLLIIAALRPFKFNTSDEDQQIQEIVEFVKFKRFNALYPMIYSIFVAVKIIFLAIFSSNDFSVYILWTLQISYIIGYLYFRPYKRTRDIQQNYCYLFHNLHNIWNSFGLCVLIGVILMENLQVNQDTYVMNTSIRITILIIEAGSLIFAYLRLFASTKLTGFQSCCKNNQEIDNNYDQKNDLDETDRRLKNQSKGQNADKKESKHYNRQRRETSAIKYK